MEKEEMMWQRGIDSEHAAGYAAGVETAAEVKIWTKTGHMRRYPGEEGAASGVAKVKRRGNVIQRRRRRRGVSSGRQGASDGQHQVTEGGIVSFRQRMVCMSRA
jgi:hypothetical protein